MAQRLFHASVGLKLHWQVVMLIAVCTAPSRAMHQPHLKHPIHVCQPGDIHLGGLFPVHFGIESETSGFLSHPLTAECIGFNFRGTRWLMAMMFAVEQINNNWALLPNVTLGYKLSDTCNTICKALEATLAIIIGNFRENHLWGSPTCGGFNTLGVVGATGSSASMAVANLLSLFNVPQVSYASSSRLLSNRQQYQTFLRTVPSDDQQSAALADIVHHFGWTWIGVVSSDDEYGRPGIESFRNHAEANGVCVEFANAISRYDSPEDVQTVANIISNSTTNVIVAFASGTDLEHLMLEIVRRGLANRTWIASDGWSTSSLVARPGSFNILGGTLGLALPEGHIPGFRDYLLRTHPNRWPENHFIKQLWEFTFNCTWRDDKQNGMQIADKEGPTLSTSKENGHEVPGWPFCTGKENLSAVETPFLKYEALRVTYSVYQAVYTIAYALHSTMSQCHHQETCDTPQRPKLRGNFYGNDGISMSFNAMGRPHHLYSIINWQADGENIHFQVVGQYNGRAFPGNRLQLNHSKIVWNGGHSEVPYSHCSSPCPPGTRKGLLKGVPYCCFKCQPCTDGKFSNETDASNCEPCHDDFWPSSNRTTCLPKNIEFLSWKETIGVLLTLSSVLGASLTIFFAFIFLKYRQTPIVKASNRDLCILILFALFCCFLSALLFIGRPSPANCKLRQPAFVISFTVCVSCMLVKTHHVLWAFNERMPGRKHSANKRRRQVFLVIPYTAVQVGICAMWLILSPPFLDPQSSKGTICLICNEGSPIGLVSVLGYLFLLACFCFLMAFRARKLPENFNEAKLITFSMLVFFIVWLSFVPTYISARGKLIAAVEAMAILASAYGVLGCAFVHRCYIILFRSELNTVEEVRCCTAAHTFKRAARANLRQAKVSQKRQLYGSSASEHSTASKPNASDQLYSVSGDGFTTLT
uniref:Calcium-sensing receptor n=1 Tax=Eptatretus burgeri TaxID=7764 RepID=A0A8C4N2M1_EPTBU